MYAGLIYAGNEAGQAEMVLVHEVGGAVLVLRHELAQQGEDEHALLYSVATWPN